ncbi:MAG: hypothetical protein UX39_C0001G0012 [Candidatus Magasanikbacteria bacterium GW2011_GWA2_46_17]|uniref:Uncharacterized protein n=1 Tax=Candidatus Magasanikbacteria bacterium GW2011_GWA2_46_17 TaxID=1619042 RepID=A0A0G1P3X2_9BACT|nr:MAG: hypothetical protein UX39_C0001G0012 [Candidatus Magasanikbacteria bacterium GW2011_GWA2_46_17]
MSMLNPYDHNNHSSVQIKKNETGKKVSYERYQTPPGEEFSNRKLKWAMWYEKRRLAMYKITLVGLILTSVALWAYSFTVWINYLAFGIEEDGRLARDLTASVDYTRLHARFGAKPPEIINTQILPGGSNKFDLLAEIANPNPRFLVFFSYHFIVEGSRTPSKLAVVLPGETKIIAWLGLDAGPSSEPTVVLENVSWKRISAHKIKDVELWQKYRLDFTLSDFAFRRSSPDAAHADMLTFKLTNNSPFGFAQSEFYLALYQDQSLVGIKQIQFDTFLSQETKAVDLRNFAPNLTVTNVAPIPLINVYDSAVYL